MDRGDRVIVIDYRGRKLPRIVWENAGKGVWVCTPERYREALKEGSEPNCSAFPREDVSVAEAMEEPAKRKPAARAQRSTRKGKHAKTG
jgi:hypothetical protein